MFADIDPVTLNLDPEAAAAAVTERTAALLPVHIFGYPADLPALRAARAADRRGRLRGAGRGPRRRRRGRRPRPPGGVRLLRQQAADDRRGRDGHHRRRGGQGAARLRAQPGPGARHGLARPRPARLQLPAVRHRLRARAGPARAARRDAGRPRGGGRRSTGRRWPGSRGWTCPARTPAATAGAGSSTWSSCRAGSTATTTVRALSGHGIPSKPYLPAIHLMSFYRERFGHREGEFPVCEDVAARSIALPFFPADDRGPGGRVADGAARGDPRAAERRRAP